MSFDKGVNGTITFDCDSEACLESFNVNIADARAGTSRREPFPDLLPCWDIALDIGWVSFKRTGHDWTYHCPKCAEKAAADHAEWNKSERERERVKERNSRYFE